MMPVTPLGFVSPETDDPVDVPDDMHEQATSVDNYLTPQRATVTPGPAPYSGTLRLTRTASIVQMEGGVRPGGSTAPTGNTWVTIGQLPTAMIPVSEVVMPGAIEPRSGVTYELRVDETGVIQIRHYVTATGNTLSVGLGWSTAASS